MRKLADSFVEEIGHGPTILVVHGGPGLDHAYLVKWLRPLRSHLVFFDQVGCGADQTPLTGVTAQSCVDQFGKLCALLASRGPFTVLAHSWGAYIVLKSLIEARAAAFAKLILVSPVGLTRTLFDASGVRLLSRIPRAVLDELERLEAHADGAGIMNLLLPYYLARVDRPSRIRFDYYSPAVFEAVTASLGSYDLRHVAEWLPPLLLIYGDADIEDPDATKEIHSRARLSIVADAGHFSFAEQPVIFRRLVSEFLGEQESRRG